jgi:sec-independent protein translocase protein TatB
MLDIGPGELLLVAIIGLLVLGPQRLPKVAAEIGKWVGRARRTATQLRRQLEREIELSDLQTPPPQNPPPQNPFTQSQPPAPPAAPQPPAASPAPPYGEVPDGPGTHSDQPPIGQPDTPADSARPEQRAEPTPPS